VATHLENLDKSVNFSHIGQGQLGEIRKSPVNCGLSVMCYCSSDSHKNKQPENC